MVESIGIAGFDSVILDMEHTPISFETLYVCVLAAKVRGINTILKSRDPRGIYKVGVRYRRGYTSTHMLIRFMTLTR